MATSSKKTIAKPPKAPVVVKKTTPVKSEKVSKNTKVVPVAPAVLVSEKKTKVAPVKRVAKPTSPPVKTVVAKVAEAPNVRTLEDVSKNVANLPKAEGPTPAIEGQLETKLAKQPPRALNSPIRIFQIYFEGWQRELLDPAFYPLDNSRSTSELMEFNVFEQLQRNAATQGAT